MGFGDFCVPALMNGLRSGGDGDIAEVERFDGASLMIEHLLQAFGDDVINLQSLNLWL